MVYISIVLNIIVIILLYNLNKTEKEIKDKVEDTALDLMITESKVRQLYREYEILKSQLQNDIKRIK